MPQIFLSAVNLFPLLSQRPRCRNLRFTLILHFIHCLYEKAKHPAKFDRLMFICVSSNIQTYYSLTGNRERDTYLLQLFFKGFYQVCRFDHKQGIVKNARIPTGVWCDIFSSIQNERKIIFNVSELTEKAESPPSVTAARKEGRKQFFQNKISSIIFKSPIRIVQKIDSSS